MLAALLISTLLAPQDLPEELGWKVRQLGNGPRIYAMQAPGASLVSAFTFLPMGMQSDPAGRAQYAHLAEHMMIYATDPDVRSRIALRINGETTTRVMRLESLGSPKEVVPIVARHARWLTARVFPKAGVEFEKKRVLGELDSTVPLGNNGKWSLAAWSQYVRGREHAGVRADIAAATPARLASYLQRARSVSKARVFLVTPGDADAAVEAFVKAFRTAPSDPNPKPSIKPAEIARHDPGSNLAPGVYRRTWDLQAAQHLEWYPLPPDCTAAEAEILAELVLTSFRRWKIPVLATPVTVAGRWQLLLSQALQHPAKEDSVAQLRKRYDRVLRSAARLTRASARGRIQARRFAGPPEFASLRKRAGALRLAALVEAQWALECGYACTRLDVPLKDVPAAYRAVTAKRVAALYRASVTAAARRVIRVAPKTAK